MTSRIPLIHTFLKFPIIPTEVFKVIDCFCSVYPGEWDWTHFENRKTSQSAYVWYLHLDLKITSDFLRVFVFALSVIPLDVSVLLLPWPGGGMFLKALRDFLQDLTVEKMSGRFATYPSRIVSSWDPVKSRISTLGCLVLYFLRVMGFWEIAKQKHFMNWL